MFSLNKKQTEFFLGLGTFALALGVVFIGSLPTEQLTADTTNFTLSVTGGAITVESPTSIPLEGVTVSSNVTDSVLDFEQYEGGDFSFKVIDLKGAYSGYYTTLEASVMTGTTTSGGSTVVGTIQPSNFYVQYYTDNIDVETGSANPYVTINPAIDNTETVLSSPVTYILRNANAGYLNQVGTYTHYPVFTFYIPAFTPVGYYSTVVTFTLIEN